MRKLAAERLRAGGTDLKTALWEVLESLLASAKSGDVAAGKLILDKLAEREVEPPQGIPVGGITVVVHTGVPSRQPAEQARKRVTYEPILSAGLLPIAGKTPLPDKVKAKG